MQDHPTEQEAPGAKDLRTQHSVLGLIADEEQRPWSIEEIIRALQGTRKRFEIEDAVNQLQVIGLLNRTENIVFTSQAAAHIVRLKMLAL
jgi:hypothetical protein